MGSSAFQKKLKKEIKLKYLADIRENEKRIEKNTFRYENRIDLP